MSVRDAGMLTATRNKALGRAHETCKGVAKAADLLLQQQQEPLSQGRLIWCPTLHLHGA